MEPSSYNLFEKKESQGVLTVAQFIDILNRTIRTLNVKVIGEIGRVDEKNGHRYFTLKDEANGSVLNCIVWRSRYEIFGVKLAEGMKIIVSGRPEVYAPSGKLSFICDTIELAGEGALKKAYDALLKKLSAEGVFDQAKKRPIPRFIKTIGVITSKQGAVIHDFTTNLGKYGFAIEFIDSRVEGQLAVGDLLASIRTFKKRNIDVLVIMRGGGSFESLLAFNNETIVREIAAFPVPVIAGIGHDKDVPLAAMAADLATSTPSIAATTISQSWQEVFRQLEHYEVSIIGQYKSCLGKTLLDLNCYAQSLANFRHVLQSIGKFLQDAMLKTLAGMKLAILGANQQLAYLENTMKLNDPERQLKLGYSIVKHGGKILKSVKLVKTGEDIDISLVDGILSSEVKKISRK